MYYKTEDLWVLWFTFSFFLMGTIIFFSVSVKKIQTDHKNVIAVQMQERLHHPFKTLKWYEAELLLQNSAVKSTFGKYVVSFMSPAHGWGMNPLDGWLGNNISFQGHRRDVNLLKEMELKNRTHALEAHIVAKEHQFKNPHLNHIARTNAKLWHDTVLKLRHFMPEEKVGNKLISVPLLGIILGIFLALMPYFEGVRWSVFLKSFLILHLCVAMIDFILRQEDVFIFFQFKWILLFFSGIYLGRKPVAQRILSDSVNPFFYFKMAIVFFSMEWCMYVTIDGLLQSVILAGVLILIAWYLVYGVGKKYLNLQPASLLCMWGDLGFGSITSLLMAEKNTEHHDQFKDMIWVSFIFSMGILGLLILFNVCDFYIQSHAFWVSCSHMASVFFLSAFAQHEFFKQQGGVLLSVALFQWTLFYVINLGTTIFHIGKSQEDAYDSSTHFLKSLPLFPLGIVISLFIIWVCQSMLGKSFFTIFVQHGVIEGFISPLREWFSMYFLFVMGLVFPVNWRDLIKHHARAITVFVLSKSVIWVCSLIIAGVLFNALQINH